MKISVVKGIAPHPNDAQYLTNLQKVKKSTLGGKTMVVGIRNAEGTIYRVIKTEGLPQFLNVIDCLSDLDLIDELEEAAGMKEGCDAIFSEP